MDQPTVHAELRQAILTARFKAGARLVTQQIADQMGVSRAPVREALARLEADGLVERTGHWGYSVRSVTLREADDLFEARMVIEVANARFAAARIDDEGIDTLHAAQRRAHRLLERRDHVAFQLASRRVHESIASAAGNAQLERMFRRISDFVVLFGLTLIERSPSRAREIVEENDRIVDAVVARRPDDAAAATAEHIERAHRHFHDAVGARRVDLRLVGGPR